MRISAVIPAHNEEKYIGACLSSVIKNGGTDIFEIIVVDNNSTDATAAAAATFPMVKVLREERKGPTFARKKGFDATTGDLVAFFDADTQVPAGWGDIVRREFAKDPKLVCLSGPFRYYDLPPFQNFLAGLLWGMSALPVYWAIGFMALTANAVVRREALEKIGGLDTTITFYGDDTNLAWRMSKVGKVKFMMRFFIYGSGRRLVKEGLLKTFFIYGINYLWMAVRHTPFTKEYKDIR